MFTGKTADNLLFDISMGSTGRRLVYVLSNFSKTCITLLSVVLNFIFLIPQLRLRQDYECVLSDLFLYSFAIFFANLKLHMSK